MDGNLIVTTIAGITDIGLVRTNNEDCLLISDPYTGQYLGDHSQYAFPPEHNRLLIAVSDGMGGAEGGEIASKLTVYLMQSELPRLSRRLSPQSRLAAAIEEANSIVRQERKTDPRLHAMGATITAVLIERNVAYIAEIGDSRAYILRNGRIKQLTTDQTMIQVMLDSGMITPQAAATSNNRNVLLQAVGIQEHLQIAVNSIELKRHDLLLLCSDGLSGKITAEEMLAIIKHYNDLATAANEMVLLAKQRGGEDNISVILAHIDGDGLRPNTQEPLSRAIRVLSRFDPEQEAQPRAKLLTRSATMEDLVEGAFVEYFAYTENQRRQLMSLVDIGDYLVCRRGDSFTVGLEVMPDSIYCLLSGCYRLEIESLDNQKHTIAVFISPTDTRSDEEIQFQVGLDLGLGVLRIRRQFMVGSMANWVKNVKSAFLWCEDEENILIEIPHRAYLEMGRILGERFINAIKYT